MSWLLAERAVYNGEISILELVSEKYSLSEIDGCENSGHRDNYALPVLLRKLIYRSHVLYLRVSAIEKMVRASVSELDGVNKQIMATGKLN